MERVDGNAMDISGEPAHAPGRAARAAFRPRIGVVDNQMDLEKIAPKHKAAAPKQHAAEQHQDEHKKEVDGAAKMQHAVEHVVNDAKEKHKEAAAGHRASDHANGKANYHEAALTPNIKLQVLSP
jgi:hypothetical protein